MNAINQITVDANEVGEAVRQTAMLADVTISVWGGEKSDASAMNKVREEAQATGDIGRVVKKMLAGVDGTLKDTKSAFANVRLRHYSYTLPWISDPHATRMTGARLLPNMLFERYMADMSVAKRNAMAKLDKFCAEYPDLVVQARANLGALADATYPSVDEIRSKFRVSFDFEPIPAGTSFKGLPEHVLGKLSTGLANKQNRMINAAQAAMWGEVRERVGHLLDKLSNEEAKFKTPTIENVRELLVLLPGWNITGDERASAIVNDIRAMLDNVDFRKVSDDATVRAGVVQQAHRISDKLNQWGL